MHHHYGCPENRRKRPAVSDLPKTAGFIHSGGAVSETGLCRLQQTENDRMFLLPNLYRFRTACYNCITMLSDLKNLKSAPHHSVLREWSDALTEGGSV